MNVNMSAHAQDHSRRPADDWHPDLESYLRACTDDKNLSAERNYSIRDLKAVPDNDQVVLTSPRGGAVLSHFAFGQLARTVAAPAGDLRTLSPQLAADCVNYGIANTPDGTDVTLLVRAANGTPNPLIRACTSDTYARLWDADLARGLRDTVLSGRSTGNGSEWQSPTSWSGQSCGFARGDRDSFIIQIDGGSIVTDPSARSSAPGDDKGGQLFRGILIRNSEVGAASVSIECVLFRYICGNLMIWGAVMDRQYKRRHVGSRMLRDVLHELGTIAYRWTHRPASADEAIIRLLIDTEIASTPDAVVSELKAIGATEEQARSAMATCEQTETASPRSFWGIAQGLTRDSQATSYQNDRHELDKLAALVMARGAKLVAA